MEKRFLGVQELISESVTWYKSDWKRLSLIQSFPLAVSVVATFVASSLISVQEANALALYSMLFGILSLVAYGFSWLAMMWVIAKEDKTVTWKEAYKKGWTLAVPASIVGIFTLLFVLGGFLLLIIPGIYLAITYTFVQYALFADNIQGREALRASKFYVKGHWLGVLGRSFVFGIAVGIVSMLIGAGSVGPQWGAIMQSIREGVEPQIQSNLFVDLLASAFSILVVTPLSTIYTYLMYKSLKEIKGEYTGTTQ